MPMNRPRGREKNVSGKTADIKKRGSGLGTGPVGTGSSPSGFSSKPQSSRPASSMPSGQSFSRDGGSGGSLLASLLSSGSGFGGKLILILVVVGLVVFGGGSGILSSLFGSQTPSSSPSVSSSVSSLLSSVSSANLSGMSLSSGWDLKSNNGVFSGDVSSLARPKLTSIKGNGSDVVTIMLYMCGTDLESKGGMGTADLEEMLNAASSSHVNLIVYTGGCSKWKTSSVSNTKNEIFKIEKDRMICLSSDAGSGAMTNPNTLIGFIRYCEEHYPANRNMLVLWDHGGGSVTGYGYDEKFASSGSLTLPRLQQVLQTVYEEDGVTFDCIGFDACLMASVETALTLAPYADYMIASEETEPGIGWYYTDWLSALAANPSMPTIEIGRRIADDFVTTCERRCPGQKATLSVTDLAELGSTLSTSLGSFATGASDLITSGKYRTVSDARAQAREFSPSSRLDQVDLADFAALTQTAEGEALVRTLLSAVKYNRVSSDMTNAYGLSAYFPYRKATSVDTATNTCEQIGMDPSYVRCMEMFASVSVGGQASASGSGPLSTLLGASSSSGISGNALSSLLSQLSSGSTDGIAGLALSGLTSGNLNFFGRSIGVDQLTEYIDSNRFDPSLLAWQKSEDGTPLMALSGKQWGLVQDLVLNVFYDDGEGYLDLGLDNIFDFTERGELIGEYDGTWLAINDHPVAYYYMNTIDDGENYSITGYVPILLNGSRAELLLVFDNENPYGRVTGARPVYHDGETETVAKALTELKKGDKIDFLCDYYTYDGEYQDTYYLGDPLTVEDEFVIENVTLDRSRLLASYRFTDIYQQNYWTPVIPD